MLQYLDKLKLYKILVSRQDSTLSIKIKIY